MVLFSLYSNSCMSYPSSLREAETLVVNLHRRYAGVAATMRALVPVQQGLRNTAFLDSSFMGLEGTINLKEIFQYGWSVPPGCSRRIWHSRRPLDQAFGLFCKHVLRQPWELIYTSPSPRRHGLFWRAIVNRSAAIIAVTDQAASFLDWHTGIVPHGVDVREFHPPADKRIAWQESGLPGKYGIGVFGRIRPDKGTDLFVSAMCEILPAFPDFTAVIAGLCKPKHRGFRAHLVRKIKAAGLEKRIVFLGDLDFADIKRWYQRVSLCVAVPRSEGFGLTPLEAMASGAAALTSSEGCFPQLIVPGVNGEIVPTDDVVALSHTLEAMLANPGKLLRMGEQARNHIADHHSIEHEAESIHAIYDAVLAEADGN